MEIYIQQFVVFMLLFVRVGSFFVSAPLLGHQSVPVQVKVGVSVFIAYIMFPIVSAQSTNVDVRLLAFFLLALKEALVGLLLGFLSTLFFAGVRYAGEIFAYNMNLNIANMFDPESNQTNPVIGEFIYLTAVLMFLLLDGHHFLLESFALTYATVPLGSFALSVPLYTMVMNLAAGIFVAAVKIAAPIIVTMFLINVALAILSRVMPQMNVFMMAFPLNVGVGLIVLISTSSIFIMVIKKMLQNFESSILELVKVL